MPKVAANQLTDAEVQFISLVSNGANRDPFRITKSSRGAEPMIDLGRIPFFKREEVKPQVAFVAVSKSFGAEAAKALLEKAGLEQVGEIQEQDNGLFIKTAEFGENDGLLTLKLSDDVVAGILGPNAELIQKGFSSYSWESTDFKTVLAQESVFPMVSIACCALQDTIYNAMYKADDSKEAGTMIDAALNDFAEVVRKTIKTVPQVAFKLDQALAELGATQVETVEKTEDPVIEADPKETPADGTTSVVEKADEPAADPAEGEPEKVEKTEDEPAAEPEKVEKTEETPAAEPKEIEVSQTTVDLGPVMEAIAKLGTDLRAELGEVKKVADGAVAGLKKMDEAISGGLVSGEPEDDRERSNKSDKGDEEVQWEAIDTGYGNPFLKADGTER